MCFENSTPLVKYSNDLCFHLVNFTDGIELELTNVREDEFGVVFLHEVEDLLCLDVHLFSSFFIVSIFGIVFVVSLWPYKWSDIH